MEENDRLQVIQIFESIKRWEKSNLPTYGSVAGQDLFLQLALLHNKRNKSLKELYLSLNCAESTARILLRNLEMDGWIHLPKNKIDERFKHFVLTDKSIKCIEEWVKIWLNMLHLYLNNKSK